MRSELVFVLCVALPACGDAEPAAVASCPVPAAASTQTGPFRFTALELSHGSSCGLGNDGSVACWTSQDFGSLRVSGVLPAIAIEIDQGGGWAVRDGGSVLRWTGSDRLTVSGVCGATAITENRCAIVLDGEVRCWQVRNPTQLGLDPRETDDGRAVTIPGVRGAVGLASGPEQYTCAAIEDGSVTCWGGGSRPSDRPGPEPASVPELAGVRSIVGSQDGGMLGAYGGDVCAILTDGSVSCWTPARAPAPTRGLVDVVSLSISRGHGCAALGDGSAACWGANERGQLGNGTTDATTVPVPVSRLSGVTHVGTWGDGGRGYSCAVLADGTAWCWGAERFGSFSDGNVDDSSVPVVVPFP
jgi:hypothetical protein